MEFKLFSTPQFHDAQFYADREVADHIHQPGHRERLLEAVEQVCSLYEPGVTVADLGAGNGGLLSELKKRLPGAKTWGYDLSPKAVEYAREVYGVAVTLRNITESFGYEPGHIVILTEVLEHLVSPHYFVRTLRCRGGEHGAQYVIASSPAAETPDHHYEFHLWAWTGDSYAQMFERAGWEVLRHYVRADCGTQFVVAGRP